jgi:hypothetical protein
VWFIRRVGGTQVAFSNAGVESQDTMAPS